MEPPIRRSSSSYPVVLLPMAATICSRSSDGMSLPSPTLDPMHRCRLQALHILVATSGCLLDAYGLTASLCLNIVLAYWIYFGWMHYGMLSLCVFFPRDGSRTLSLCAVCALRSSAPVSTFISSQFEVESCISRRVFLGIPRKVPFNLPFGPIANSSLLAFPTTSHRYGTTRGPHGLSFQFHSMGRLPLRRSKTRKAGCNHHIRTYIQTYRH
jgi:hypothetical protein